MLFTIRQNRSHSTVTRQLDEDMIGQLTVALGYSYSPTNARAESRVRAIKTICGLEVLSLGFKF